MQQQPLQDTTTATIKALTDKINQLGSGSGGRESGHGRGQYRTLGSSRFLRNNDGGIRTTRQWNSDNCC